MFIFYFFVCIPRRMAMDSADIECQGGACGATLEEIPEGRTKVISPQLS